MNSVLHSAPFRSPHHGIAVQFFWAVAIGIVFGVATLASAQTLAQTGQWSPAPSPPPVPLSWIVVHLALLPDGGPYNSRIILWDEDGLHNGAELGWNPGTAGCGGWPYPDLASLPTAWSPQANIFCAGHAQLATGPGLLTVGGDDKTSAGVWGIPDALAFTPDNGWSARSDMQQARFYPTISGSPRRPHAGHRGPAV